MRTFEQAVQRALRELTPGEKRNAVVYADENIREAGSELEIDGRAVRLRSATLVVFVDREPQANWGHSSRYLLVDLADERAESIESQFPPFVRGVPPTLRVIAQGESVPDWAIARP